MSTGGADPIRVLLVEDDDALADLTAEYLEREDDAFDVETRAAAEPALDYLDATDVDCVVSDHDMPGMNGLEFLEVVREGLPDLPFVLFTGKGSEEIASDAISAGVTDYLQKRTGTDQYTVLANRVRNAVEKRRSQRELREEKHLLEQVLATTPGSVVFQPEGRVASATDRARATLGLADADFPVEPDWELATLDGDAIPEDDHPVRRVARTGQPVHGERLTVEWPDGWEKHLVMHCAPLFDADGNVDRVVASFTDVTDRVEHEREIERVQTVVQAVGDAVYTLDEDGVFTFVNDAFEDLTGRPREALVGEHCSVVLADDDLAAGQRLVGSLVDGDADTGVHDLDASDWADGVEHVEAHVGLLPYDVEFSGIAGVARDVSDRRERDRERRQYETIVETAPDAVFIVDEDANYVGGNDQVARLTGYSRDELAAMSVDDLVDAGVFDPEVVPRYRETVSELLSADADREKAKFEFRVTPRDGDDTRVVECHLALRPYDDEFRGTIGVLRDVTERNRRERRLETQNERLDEFARVVTHDVRSPLNVATGWLDQYRETGSEDALDRVESAHDRIDEILEELLTLARDGTDDRDTDDVSLQVVAISAWDAVDTGDSHIGIDAEDVTVDAVPGRLQELFENLFRNAVEHAATPESQQAQLDGTFRETDPEARVVVSDLEDREGFYVADDGPGIPESERDDVFEMGHTTDEDGTGFGLAIVADIAENHGWTVTLTESEDGGARFEFET